MSFSGPAPAILMLDSLGSGENHAEFLQVCTQLFRGLHLDDLHSQACGAIQIQRAIVNEAALFGRPLRDLQGEAVDSFLGLAQSDKARAYEKAEDFAQIEGLDAVQIQL